MYQNFYDLNENPFNLTPDPRFHYVNQSTREALAALLYGIESRKGIITLVGDAGTGKTTLLKRVFETIQEETRMVFVFNPGVSFDELLEFICLDLGIHTDNSRRLHLLDRLNRYLLEQLTGGHNVVVMIDEAQTLNDDTLEQLRLLTNLETAKEKTLQIVLSGQTELEEKLRKPSMRQLRQRIGARAMLRPMEKGEIGAYIETRLSSAGAEDPRMFGAKALKRIWRASGGIARVVNVICDSALVIGFAKSERRLSNETVKEAIRDLTGEGRVPGAFEKLLAWVQRPVQRYLAATAAVVAVAVPLAILLQRSSLSQPAVSQPPPARSYTELPRRPELREPAEAVVAPSHRHDAVDEPRSAAVVVQVRPVKADELPAGHVAEVESRESVVPAVEAPSRAEASLDAPVDGPVVRDVPPTAPTAGVPDGMVEDTIRRAELLARSAAARLYQEPEKGPSLESSSRPRPDELVENKGQARAPASAARAVSTGSALPGSALPPAGSSPAHAVKADHQVLVVAERTAEPVPVPPLKATTKPKTTPTPMPTPIVAARAVTSVKPAKTAAPAKPLKSAKDVSRARAAGAARVVVPARKADLPAASKPSSIVKAKPPTRHSADVQIFGWAAGSPPVGRLVRLRGGDTVWKVATRYYPDAGSATVEALVAHSPTLKTMGPVEGGELMLLPFLTAQEMVGSSFDGSYRVLLARAPSRRRTESAAKWARTAVPRFSLRWESPQSGDQPYNLYAVGFRSRNDALAAADYVLFKLAELHAGR